MNPLNQHHEEILRDAARQLSRSENLTNICQSQWQGEPLPSHSAVKEIITLCRALIFPGFFGDSTVTRSNITYHTGLWAGRLYTLLCEQIHAGLSMGECNDSVDNHSDTRRSRAADKAAAFIKMLPQLRMWLNDDVKATYHGDPAATSIQEIIYCYPGLRAISAYRIAHNLYELGVPIIPRMISEHSHSETGVDIHPAAAIGRSFTIDHGTGIVVGATSIIGNNVKIYQGVTLGARSFDLDDNGNPVKGVPRHPIIGNGVVIYSNATILGRITVGDNAVIGGNIWVTTDVAPGERIIQAKANNVLRLKN
ncbi:serine acetyltransferase [uncultured Muribaculum sp.]|jgi:serine O-acetyltransferase|uniref:serine O-acetyltransferase n=1 Tax=uncultured Muribaculum sp. TaxID=1918613 RepID=UPI0025B275EA|nr:serine acetyltransferase [uncultured Muribaculum sp.]